ncbi:hypothetical protein D3C85_822020 [compost metagenome]
MQLMESKTTIPDIKLTIQSGGSLVFEKTGILPEFLIFHSKQLQRTWRLKLKEDKQNGVLKVNGQITFHYFFDGLGCKMQSVTEGVVTGEWEIEEIMMELRD